MPLLDEATAAAEAMAMAKRVARSKATAFFVDRDCHPQTIAVVRTRAEPLGWQVIVADPMTDLDPTAVFGALSISRLLRRDPGFSAGDRRSPRHRLARGDGGRSVGARAAHSTGRTRRGHRDRLDPALRSSDRLWGPHAAYIATRQAHQRALPGRLVGVSVDSRGQVAYRLALQTREQHIRREKATSNICTAQVLLAVIASMYAIYHGRAGSR